MIEPDRGWTISKNKLISIIFYGDTTIYFGYLHRPVSSYKSNLILEKTAHRPFKAFKSDVINSKCFLKFFKTNIFAGDGLFIVFSSKKLNGDGFGGQFSLVRIEIVMELPNKNDKQGVLANSSVGRGGSNRVCEMEV